jgi:hypothetical protein
MGRGSQGDAEDEWVEEGEGIEEEIEIEEEVMPKNTSSFASFSLGLLPACLFVCLVSQMFSRLEENNKLRPTHPGWLLCFE